MTNTKPTSSLELKLKLADPEVQQYVLALEKKLLKLKRQNMTLNNRIKVLKRNFEKRTYQEQKEGGDIDVQLVPGIHKKLLIKL